MAGAGTAQEHRGGRAGRDREHGPDHERRVVAVDERGQGAVVARAGRGDARQDRQPERAAHHERGVDDARGDTRVLGRDVAHRGEQERVHRHPDPEAENDHARQHVDGEAAVDRRAREEREAERDEPHPQDERRLDAEAQHELGGQAERERAHDQVRRQEREADLQRGVAEHELEVEGREEEHREHRGRPEDADDVRGRDAAQPQQPERHQRRRDARLEHEEGHDAGGRGAEHPERAGGGPPLLVAVHDRVDGEHRATPSRAPPRRRRDSPGCARRGRGATASR